MTASEDWQAAFRRIMDEYDAADKAARRKAEADHWAAREADGSVSAETLVPALGYIRVNTRHLTTDSDAQRAAIERWAGRTGHVMVGWVEDVLVDGTGRTTAALEELVNRVAAGDAAVVVAESSVRIARKLAIVKAWSDRIQAAGGRLVLIPAEVPSKRVYRG